MTFLEHQTAVLNDLSAETTDAFFTLTQVKSFINRGIKLFAGLHFWSETKEAYKRQMTDDELAEGLRYFDNPETFYSDSIYRIDDDNGKEYIKKNWEDFLRYITDDQTKDDYIFAVHNNQFFVNPIPTEALEFSLWGHKIPDTQTADADTHPFSYDAEACELINDYAIGLALKKARGGFLTKGINMINQVKQEAENKWKKQKSQQAEYQAQNNEMFSEIEIIPQPGGTTTERGNFVYTTN